MTIYEFLLSKSDDICYQIIYLCPLICDECRSIYCEIDNEYSIFGNVGNLRNNDLSRQYDGIFDWDMSDVTLLYVHNDIWLIIEGELHDRPDNAFNGDLCRDCKHGKMKKPFD